MSARNIFRGKGGRCVGLTTLPPSCADCLENWEPQPPGNLRTSPGLYRDCFTFTVIRTEGVVKGSSYVVFIQQFAWKVTGGIRHSVKMIV
jgi:hypothetical protein